MEVVFAGRGLFKLKLMSFLLKGIIWLSLGFFSEAPGAVSLAMFLLIACVFIQLYIVGDGYDEFEW